MNEATLANARRPGQGFESDEQRKAFFARGGGRGSGGGRSASTNVPGGTGRMPHSATSPGPHARPIARADGGFGPAETLRPVTTRDRIRSNLNQARDYGSSLIPGSRQPEPWDIRRHAHQEVLRERTAWDRVRSLAGDLAFLRPTSHVGPDDPAVSRYAAHAAELAIPAALTGLAMSKLSNLRYAREMDRKWNEVTPRITRQLRERNALYAPELNTRASVTGRYLSPAEQQRIASGTYHHMGHATSFDTLSPRETAELMRWHALVDRGVPMNPGGAFATLGNRRRHRQELIACPHHFLVRALSRAPRVPKGIYSL